MTSSNLGVRLAVIGSVIALIVAACGSGTTASPRPSAADPTKDKLAQIQARGTLVAYAALDYAPQSFAVVGATRAANTKCLSNQMTAPEMTGFDIETTNLVAAKLGVEVCYVFPDFDLAAAGDWGDRFDIVYGSGAINTARMAHLWMTQPYYYIPQRFAVLSSSNAQKLSDLDGKRIGTCSGCTVESYLKGTLQIPGVDIVQKVKNPQLVGYAAEDPGLVDLAAGKIDAFLTAEPVAMEAITEGKPLRLLDETAFSMYPSGFVDKGSGLSAASFVNRVNEIIRAAHADGTLKAMSMKWFGTDYTTPAGAFDLSKLGQQIP